MAKNLASLARTLGTATVTLRGEDFAVRALTARESDLLDRVYERPGPPMKPDPGAGSQSDRLVPDTTDPVYRRALSAYLAESRPAEVAIACDLEITGQRFSAAWEKDVKKAREWCAAARAFVLDELRLTRGEMEAVLQAADGCVAGARSAAGKPSSSPSSETTPPAPAGGRSPATSSPPAAG